MLDTLGRLTSEETREWAEPEPKEVELIEREGAGDGGSEDTLEGMSGSAGERERRGRDLVSERRVKLNDPTKNRAFMKSTLALPPGRLTCAQTNPLFLGRGWRDGSGTPRLRGHLRGGGSSKRSTQPNCFIII